MNNQQHFVVKFVLQTHGLFYWKGAPGANPSNFTRMKYVVASNDFQSCGAYGLSLNLVLLGSTILNSSIFHAQTDNACIYLSIFDLTSEVSADTNSQNSAWYISNLMSMPKSLFFLFSFTSGVVCRGCMFVFPVLCFFICCFILAVHLIVFRYRVKTWAKSLLLCCFSLALLHCQYLLSLYSPCRSCTRKGPHLQRMHPGLLQGLKCSAEPSTTANKKPTRPGKLFNFQCLQQTFVPVAIISPKSF